MKKKLLALLLSIAVILTSTVTVLASDENTETITSFSTGEDYDGGTDFSDHFKVDYDSADEDGWEICVNEVGKKSITISSTGNELIKKIDFIVNYVSPDNLTKDKFNTSNQSGTFDKSGDPNAAIKVGDVITLAFNIPVSSADVGYVNNLASMSFKSATIYKATISDILATNPDFPTTAEKAWVNSSNADATVYSGIIGGEDGYLAFHAGTQSVGPYLTETVINDGGSYKHISGRGTTTFNMSNGKLASIAFAHDDGAYAKYDGTYAAPLAPISDVSFEYVDFDFSGFTFKLPTSPDGAKYGIDGISYQVGLIKGEEIVYDYDNANGYWVDEGGIKCNPDVSKIDRAFIHFDVVASGDNTFAENVVKVTAIKKGTSTAKELSGADGLFEEGFNFGTKKIECTLLFDAFAIKDYIIIEGNEITINVDNNKDTLFASNAPYDKFYVDKQLVGKVLVDDKLVEPSNYTHASGSTEVTLKASYLSTLSNGKHTLSIVSIDGAASTYFTITRNPKPSPTPTPGYAIPKTGVE